METKKCSSSKGFKIGFVIVVVASLIYILRSGYDFGQWLAN